MKTLHGQKFGHCAYIRSETRTPSGYGFRHTAAEPLASRRKNKSVNGVQPMQHSLGRRKRFREEYSVRDAEFFAVFEPFFAVFLCSVAENVKSIIFRKSRKRAYRGVNAFHQPLIKAYQGKFDIFAFRLRFDSSESVFEHACVAFEQNNIAAPAHFAVYRELRLQIIFAHIKTVRRIFYRALYL